MTQPVDERTQLARRFRVEIDIGNGTPDWQPLIGVKEFQPATTPVRQPDTTYDDDGWRRQITTGMEWELTATIAHRANPQTGEWNPVHEYLRAKARQYAPNDEVRVRYYDRNGLPEAYEGSALVEWAPAGGAQDATDDVEITFVGQGELVEIDNPVTNGGGGE